MLKSRFCILAGLGLLFWNHSQKSVRRSSLLPSIIDFKIQYDMQSSLTEHRKSNLPVN